MGNFCGTHDLFWPAEPLSPTAGAGHRAINHRIIEHGSAAKVNPAMCIGSNVSRMQWRAFYRHGGEGGIRAFGGTFSSVQMDSSYMEEETSKGTSW